MPLTRRDILAGIPGLVGGYAIAQISPSRSAPRALRLAHLTDFHIRPGLVPEKGVTTALEHAQSQGADLIINGGDAIYDALHEPLDSVNSQWRVFDRVFQQTCHTPVLHVIGNHDVWGWATPERQPESKQRTVDRLGMKRSYYSVERSGWKLIVLDSVGWAAERSSGYRASLGEEQFLWLSDELEDNTLPCCVISHIPLFSACCLFDGPNEQSGNWIVPGEWMHLDARPVKDLFRLHREVKLCLSGHIHLAEHLNYLGVSYFCNGAVCGNYWRGDNQEFPPAYALVDLYPDGTFTNRLITYNNPG